jgi:hypothetical protein
MLQPGMLGVLRGAFASGVLFSTLPVASGFESPSPERPTELPLPLSAEAFTEAVLAHNASLEAMRQASIAAQSPR